MNDTDCTAFLQWALPQRELRWPGFRKVRRQVGKRLKQRMRDLGLDSYSAYRARLEADPSEWRSFDECCHITISRFFRDRSIFEVVRGHVLPDIAARAKCEERDAQAWSGAMLARARKGCFAPTSLHELPQSLIEPAFDRVGSQYCIRPQYREGIEFLEQDLRTEMPRRLFDLILCRYVAFTYFAVPLQHQVLMSMLERLRPQGYLVIGTHEQLPGDVPELVALATARQIFQRKALVQEP